jgi:hypothetical protein
MDHLWQSLFEIPVHLWQFIWNSRSFMTEFIWNSRFKWFILRESQNPSEESYLIQSIYLFFLSTLWNKQNVIFHRSCLNKPHTENPLIDPSEPQNNLRWIPRLQNTSRNTFSSTVLVQQFINYTNTNYWWPLRQHLAGLRVKRATS